MPLTANGSDAITGSALTLGAARRTLSVFDWMPDLLAGVPPEDARLLRRHGIATRLTLEPGPWIPAAGLRPGPHWLGLLVLGGVVARCTSMGDELRSEELLGSGDLLRPWDEDDAGGESVPVSLSWTALTPTTLAVLDGRFASVVLRWPSVLSALFARSAERARSRSVILALSRTRRAEVRLLLLFFHLADRWGRMGPNGIVVPVPLTHERLAQLVCLRRPTVSVALQQLRRDGLLERASSGDWLLRATPEDVERLRNDDLQAAA